MTDASVGQVSLLPVYLLLDLSPSMRGFPTGAIQCELDAVMDELDSRTVDRIHLGIIAFGGSAVPIAGLADISDIATPVRLPDCGSGTNYRAAFDHLAVAVVEDQLRLAATDRRIEPPLVILVTDGCQNGSEPWEPGLAAFCASHRPTFVVVGIGESSAESLASIVRVAGGFSTAFVAPDGLPFIPVLPQIIAAAAVPPLPPDSGLRRIV